MGLAPYVPAPFATPVANPAVASLGRSFPYISNTEYVNWPQAQDVTNLIVGTNADGPQTQAQALATLIATASGMADEICFGMDAAAKGASLCASVSVETDWVESLGGAYRLICDYKPVVQLIGLDMGFSANTLSSVGPGVAALVRFGIRTIYVPAGGPFVGASAQLGIVQFGSMTPYPAQQMAVWSYVAGYPHTLLAAPATAGATTLTVAPTDGGTGLVGVIPGQTQLTIADAAQTETVTVAAVSGTTVTLSAPTAYAHALPAAPDFIAVTAVPRVARSAVVYLTTHLIKSQGNAARLLAGTTNPQKLMPVGDTADVYQAKCLLNPFRVRIKAPRH